MTALTFVVMLFPPIAKIGDVCLTDVQLAKQVTTASIIRNLLIPFILENVPPDSLHWHLINKKSVRVIPDTRPACWDPGIAHLSWTSKLAEPHAECIKRHGTALPCCLVTEYTFPHKSSTICYILDWDWSFPGFNKPRKSVSKRFSICLHTHPHCPFWALQCGLQLQSYKFFYYNK